MNDALDFPLPPTTSPHVAEPRPAPSAAPPAPAAAPPAPAAAPPAPAAAPAQADALTALRAKVAELEQVVSLARTRVESLGAEKRDALERGLQLEAQLEAAERREAELLARLATHEAPPATHDPTVAELLHRVAALEAIVAPSRPT